MSEEPSAAPVVPPAGEVLEPAAEIERQFHEEVLPDELAYMRDRRASHGLAAGAGELATTADLDDWIDTLTPAAAPADQGTAHEPAG